MMRIYLFVLAFSLLMGCAKKPQSAPCAGIECVNVADVVVYKDIPPERIPRVPAIRLPRAPAMPPNRSLYYGVNKDGLTPLHKLAISRISAALEAFPTATITVTGYADTTGTAKYNQRLSRRRAMGVVNALAAAGIERARLSAIGMGEIHGPLNKSRKATITISP